MKNNKYLIVGGIAALAIITVHIIHRNKTRKAAQAMVKEAITEAKTLPKQVL